MRTLVLAAIAAGSLLAEGATFDMLSCCPGEDNAREARFVWHSDSDSCLLFLAKASDTAGAHRILPHRKTEKPVTFRDPDVTYYKYEVDISGLAPGTEYVYWVEAGGESSARQKFRSAGTSGSWNFLWMSDVHAHPDNPGKMTTVELLRQDAEERTASSGGIDMVLVTGDAVKYGARYDNWQQWNGVPAVSNYMFALIPGNHEYYHRGSSSFYDYHWYLAVKNNPPNGPDATEQEGCYWFNRDGVMFVGIDSLIHKGSRMSMYGKENEVLTAQTNWFDNVVVSQRGKFRYLVVFQHDPWFVYATTKNSFDKSRGNYDVWRHVFDKHKVDLALSGDEHNYIRSKPLKGDAYNADGTIYMVAGQIEEANYSATVTKDIASFGNANATKYFDCIGATDASCGAACIEVRPDSLKVTEFWDKWQSPKYTVYDTVTITPKDRGFEYVGPTADQVPWLYECATNTRRTGTWSQDVAYGADGRAYVFNGTYTPYSASTGNVVTVETTAQFCEDTEDRTPEATVQAAVRLSSNGRFQVWTSEKSGVESGGAGELVWVDVEAEGVTPVSGEEYTLRTTFDYSAGTYSVEVKNADAWQPLKLTASTSHLSSSFPLATTANCVRSIGFVGDTLFTSLLANCAVVATGFAADEKIVLAGATNVLSAARALWLNSLGDRATVASAAASLTEKKFSDAYLLNFDITKGDFTYTFEIAGIEVLSDSVKVDVRLVRNGETKGAINGALNFYGAATLAAFKSGGTLVGTATLTEDAFDGSEKASAIFDKDGNAFYNVKIEE